MEDRFPGILSVCFTLAIIIITLDLPPNHPPRAAPGNAGNGSYRTLIFEYLFCLANVCPTLPVQYFFCGRRVREFCTYLFYCPDTFSLHCRGRMQGCAPPWYKAFFIFVSKICLPHQPVTPFLSGVPRSPSSKEKSWILPCMDTQWLILSLNL